MNRPADPNCGKCGLCLTSCPVYRQLKEEQASPRARMQLIKAHEKKNLSSSPYLKEIMSKCLMCGACSANCPSGIDHYSAFMKMREKMARDHGEPVAIKSLIYLLSKDLRTRLGSKIARTGRKMLTARLAKSLKLGSIPLEKFPEINQKPLRDTIGLTALPIGPKKGTVAYFTGCASNYLFEDTGLSVVGILTHMGYEVILPKNQTCCSIPLLFHGAADKARHNIDKNIQAFKTLDVQAVITDCSTCKEAFTKVYPSLFQDRSDTLDTILPISQKTTDILTFVHQHINEIDFKDSSEKTVVTYHAPCHSRNGSTISHIATELIEQIPSVTYKETPDMQECCGGGGTFFYEYPDISKKMVENKIQSARTVGAQKWLTDCPVCRLNLAGNLKGEDNLDVLHPITLIYSAVRQHENKTE